MKRTSAYAPPAAADSMSSLKRSRTGAHPKGPRQGADAKSRNTHPRKAPPPRGGLAKPTGLPREVGRAPEDEDAPDTHGREGGCPDCPGERARKLRTGCRPRPGRRVVARCSQRDPLPVERAPAQPP